MSNAAGLSAKAITPSDTATFSATRGLYVGVGGDVKVTMFDGTIATFIGLVAGTVHPLSVVGVFATGTTATSILAVY